MWWRSRRIALGLASATCSSHFPASRSKASGRGPVTTPWPLCMPSRRIGRSASSNTRPLIFSLLGAKRLDCARRNCSSRSVMRSFGGYFARPVGRRPTRSAVKPKRVGNGRHGVTPLRWTVTQLNFSSMNLLLMGRWRELSTGRRRVAFVDHDAARRWATRWRARFVVRRPGAVRRQASSNSPARCGGGAGCTSL